MISSQSVSVWAKSESTAGARNSKRLKVAMMTETTGGMAGDSECGRCAVPSDVGVGSGVPRAQHDVPVHRGELRPERIERQLAIEMRAHRATLIGGDARGDRLERGAELLCIPTRPQAAHRTPSGQRTKRRDIRDHRGQS